MIRTCLNYREVVWNDRFEIPEGISETVPDQSMSLRVILDRYTKTGAIPTRTFEPEYSEEDVFPDMSSMDLTEIDEYRRNLKADVDEMQAELAKADKAARDKKAKEKLAKDAREKAIMEAASKLNKNDIQDAEIVS